MSKKKEIKNNQHKEQRTLSQKLQRMIAVVFALLIAVIVLATYEGLDIVYLAYAAIDSFFASYEIEDAYTENNGDSFFYEIDTIEREHAITIEIYSPENGFVYSSSYKGEMSSPPYNSNSILLSPSEKKNYEVVEDLGSFENNSFNLMQDITQTGKRTDYLVGSWKAESGITIKIFKVKSTVDTTAKIAVTFVSFVTVAVALLAMFVISAQLKRITKPLGEMSEITKNMSNLDFSQKCEATNVREISVLADSINEMSDSLETSLHDLQQKNKKLQDDIEQEKTIDQLRQVFISGVSHELKTPIAIIQGYAEGLKFFLDSDPATAEKYCDTIISETDRMNRLVMKLLDIIKYQSGEYQPLYEKFKIFEIVESWFDRNSEILKEKGVVAQNKIDRNMICSGDSFILSTVVNNYMSNAVSHVGGDMIIEATAKEIDSERYRISIFNTGEQIAPKDIDQIWKSFYRADKAMSRAQGRFGLGLAIVASIQQLHGQEYGVLNRENGVEFWFDVKKYKEE